MHRPGTQRLRWRRGRSGGRFGNTGRFRGCLPGGFRRCWQRWRRLFFPRLRSEAWCGHVRLLAGGFQLLHSQNQACLLFPQARQFVLQTLRAATCAAGQHEGDDGHQQHRAANEAYEKEKIIHDVTECLQMRGRGKLIKPGRVIEKLNAPAVLAATATPLILLGGRCILGHLHGFPPPLDVLEILVMFHLTRTLTTLAQRDRGWIKPEPALR